MDTKDIAKAIKNIEETEYHLEKMGIFNYDTLDEVNPIKAREERIRRDITVEIGGPSTHIKFTVLTRAEHTIIKNAVAGILTSRLKNYHAELKAACVEIYG